MPRIAYDPSYETTSLWQDLQSINGAGWIVPEKEEHDKLTQADEDVRRSMMQMIDPPRQPTLQVGDELCIATPSGRGIQVDVRWWKEPNSRIQILGQRWTTSPNRDQFSCRKLAVQIRSISARSTEAKTNLAARNEKKIASDNCSIKFRRHFRFLIK